MLVSSTVPSTFEPNSVVAYLAGRFTYLSAEAWLKLVNERRVWRNGRLCTPSTPVHANDTIRCDLPDPDTPDVNFSYDII